VHYPGDVLVAAFIGAFIGGAISKQFFLVESKRLKY